MSEMTPI